VSLRDQDPKSQIEAAITRGISPANIHIETASGARHERPVLTKLLAKLESGDVLMSFRLDRLGRLLSPPTRGCIGSRGRLKVSTSGTRVAILAPRYS
jgi:DNA invertase Pin-like site-specific DNA recombinase